CAVIQANLATIMNTLTTASGSGPPPIIGMTYYDPELANWLKGTPADKELAKDSIALAQAFGNLLSGVYTSFGAKVADVFKAFHTTQFAARVTLPAFGKVPKAVGYICSYTWMCAAPPVGPNIHANRLGYAIIANTSVTVTFTSWAAATRGRGAALPGAPPLLVPAARQAPGSGARWPGRIPATSLRQGLTSRRRSGNLRRGRKFV